MTDQPSAKPPLDTQLVVALSITVGLVTIAIGLIIAGAATGSLPTTFAGVTGIIGALSTALNAPTGVSNALKAMKDVQAPPAPPVEPPSAP